MIDLRKLIDLEHKDINISRQCDLLGLSRASFYYTPKPIDEYTLKLLNLIDEHYTKHPEFGTRTMATWLSNLGYPVNRKRIQRLYGILGIEAIYPKPNTSKANKEHKVYPYLLRNVEITGNNHVWSTDITYIRMYKGFVYLVAVMDWYSRYVLSWKLSPFMDVEFCIDALTEALGKGAKCNIFNTDQGSQFTSNKFTKILLDNEIQISMDGKGRALDNVFVERLWRTVKYNCIYINNYTSVKELKAGLKEFFNFYNYERPHQSLNKKTPANIYHESNIVL